jgi:hypothetical protein
MAFLTKAANRGSIATGYDIENSLVLEDANDESMIRNYSGDGDRRTWTYSTWIKRTELSQDYYCLFFAAYTGIQFMSEDYLRVELYDGTTTRYADTTQLFRDTSAWYHLVVTLDSTDSTASDRVKIWINGSRVTDFRTSTYASMSQNDQFGIGQASSNYQFGYWFAGGANNRGFCGYVAETHYVNGTALEANDFGEYDSDSGIWIPKEYTGSHGSKGFYLKFDDSSNLGKDSSSGGIGDFTLSNITAADQATDTPTNNFCTFNPLMDQGNSPTISEGAMKSTGGGGSWNQTWGTIGTKSGKWYYEMKVTNTSSTGYFGASTTPAVSDYTNTVQLMYNTSFIVGTANGIDYYYWQNGSQTSNEATGWGNLVNNDVLGLALDLDAGTKKFYLYKNGSLLNSGGTNLPTNMQDEFIFPLYVQYENKQDEINFGGYTISSISSAASDANGYGTFEYAPPSGYYALCTKNLAQYGG